MEEFYESITESTVVKTGCCRLSNLEMSTCTRRIESYKCWPKEKFPTVEQLAKCGFYLDSTGRQLCCFYCRCIRAVSLWKPYDNPWVEHAILNPECPFLLLNRSTLSSYVWNSTPETSIQEAKSCFTKCVVS